MSELQKGFVGIRTVLSLDEVEKNHIALALETLGNHKGKTAVALGITKMTLYNKLHQYGLFERFKDPKQERNKK